MNAQLDPPLLRRARQEATKRHSKVSSLHIFVVALTEPLAAGNAGTILRRAIPDMARENFLRQASVVIDHPSDGERLETLLGTPENSSELGPLERDWKQEAASRAKPVTAALVLKTILSNANTLAARMLGEQDLAVEEIVRALVVMQDDPDRASLVDVPASTWDMAQALRDQEYAAKRLLKGYQFVQRVETTPGLPYASLNAPRLDAVLYALAQSAAGVGVRDVTVCVSVHGSVLDLLSHILADRIARHDEYSSALAVLRGVREVRHMSLRSLLITASLDENIDPAMVLRVAKMEAAEADALLIVEHVEVFASYPTAPHEPARAPALGRVAPQTRPLGGKGQAADSPSGPHPSVNLPAEPRRITEDELRVLSTEFARPGPGLVLGYYYCELSDEASQEDVRSVDVRRLFGLETVSVASVPAYSSDETARLIKEFFAQRWHNQGFDVDSASFSQVYAFADCIWVNQRRYALPMIAEYVALSAIETVTRGLNTVDTVVEDALRMLDQLLKRLPAEGAGSGGVTGDASRQGELRSQLVQARAEIHVFRQRLHPKGWRVRIAAVRAGTRIKAVTEMQQKYLHTLPAGLLLAQVFSEDDSQFYLPGERPANRQSGVFQVHVQREHGDAAGLNQGEGETASVTGTAPYTPDGTVSSILAYPPGSAPFPDKTDVLEPHSAPGSASPDGVGEDAHPGGNGQSSAPSGPPFSPPGGPRKND